MAKKSTKKKATTRKKAAASNTAKKKAKKVAKKAAAKPSKATAKRSAKKATKKVAKKTTKKPAKKTAAKTTKKPASKKSPTKKAEATPAEAPAAKKKGRKGITIVTPKPTKKPKPKPSARAVPAPTGSILGMGIGSGKPLIPSGPAPTNHATKAAESDGKKPKTPFNKRQLDKYKEILLTKRAALLGDIDSMESEALKSQSGSLSHLPQHMAEQGSETYEQSLSLDLAAADRQLLKEIDAALERIMNKTFGVCERTGNPISTERLAELPWARYSIEAAREMERRVL